ncbi:MAG: alpha/beta hydrolase [Gemmatimonadetes bacterium]|nr:alpha/beta hydrolase [Gemmatimonadota bacterium]
MQRCLLLFAFALAACTPRHTAERLILNDTVIRSADIPFGADVRQQLDVYRARRTRKPAPVIVFIYGGRWKYSTKHDYLLVGNALARDGYVSVVPNYRLYPTVRYPAWVEDGAQAIRWTRDHIAEFGGDPAQIFVVGHSSGAHTVTMLALDTHFLRDAGVPVNGFNGVRGFVSLAGPVDTTWTAPDVQELMGPSSGWPATYPYNFMSAVSPPLLLLHGTSDDVVSVGNSTRLAARIRAAGGCAQSRVHHGIDHVGIALAFALPGLDIAPVMRDVATFIRDPRGTACPITER